MKRRRRERQHGNMKMKFKWEWTMIWCVASCRWCRYSSRWRRMCLMNKKLRILHRIKQIIGGIMWSFSKYKEKSRKNLVFFWQEEKKPKFIQDKKLKFEIESTKEIQIIIFKVNWKAISRCYEKVYAAITRKSRKMDVEFRKCLVWP